MGQILYKNNNKINKNMTSYTEVTKEEFEQMAFIHKALSFSKEEAMGIVNLTRKYVNPNTPDCLSCSSNLREAKNALCSFYLLNKDYFENKFIIAESSTEVVISEVKVKTKKK